VRDFDRTSPARSPLRLPALQHDGGAHQSPGSTFKVVSALGLEIAATSDPQIDALLGGMPLPAINRLAAQRGRLPDRRRQLSAQPAPRPHHQLPRAKPGPPRRKAVSDWRKR
jgi:hypothetical protein